MKDVVIRMYRSLRSLFEDGCGVTGRGRDGVNVESDQEVAVETEDAERMEGVVMSTYQSLQSLRMARHMYDSSRAICVMVC